MPRSKRNGAPPPEVRERSLGGRDGVVGASLLFLLSHQSRFAPSSLGIEGKVFGDLPPPPSPASLISFAEGNASSCRQPFRLICALSADRDWKAREVARPQVT